MKLSLAARADRASASIEAFDASGQPVLSAEEVQLRRASVEQLRAAAPANVRDLYRVAWEPVEREDHRLTTTLEFDQPSDNQFDTRAGVEYEWSKRFAVRTGYDINASELKFSAGAGFYPEFGTVRGTLDYAYTDGGVLGAIHRVSIGGRF